MENKTILYKKACKLPHIKIKSTEIKDLVIKNWKESIRQSLNYYEPIIRLNIFN